MTYAIRTDAWTQRDTLADMRNRRSHYLAMADAADWNNEPAIACMWDDMARQEEAAIALREDAERRFAAKMPVHAVGDEIPAKTEGRGCLMWNLIAAFCSVALVAWLVAGAADSGPHCPGADPAWLGACADAPKLEGAL